MLNGLRGLAGTGAAIAVLLAAAHGAEEESAKPRNTSGVSTVWRDGKTTNVGSSTQFTQGDIVRLAEGSRLTVEYQDGASISLVGPAAMRFGQMDSQGRRVVLGSGAASEVDVKGIALEIQAPNPYDASVVLQNAKGFARVSPGDRIVFQRMGGSFGKVWRENHYIELGSEPWTLNIRDGGRLDHRERIVGDDVVEVTVGGVTVTFQPASQYQRTWNDDGSLGLSYKGAEGFGQVDVGDETSMYVFEGQSIAFDKNGDITEFSGTSHLNRPLFTPIQNDDPVENAADASPSLSRRR